MSLEHDGVSSVFVALPISNYTGACSALGRYESSNRGCMHQESLRVRGAGTSFRAVLIKQHLL